MGEKIQSSAVRTLDLAFDIVDGVGRLNLKSDGLTREGLDEDLHAEDLEGRRRQSIPHSLIARFQRAPEGRRMMVRRRDNDGKRCDFLPRQGLSSSTFHAEVLDKLAEKCGGISVWATNILEIVDHVISLYLPLLGPRRRSSASSSDTGALTSIGCSGASFPTNAGTLLFTTGLIDVKDIDLLPCRSLHTHTHNYCYCTRSTSDERLTCLQTTRALDTLRLEKPRRVGRHLSQILLPCEGPSILIPTKSREYHLD